MSMSFFNFCRYRYLVFTSWKRDCSNFLFLIVHLIIMAGDCNDYFSTSFQEKLDTVCKWKEANFLSEHAAKAALSLPKLGATAWANMLPKRHCHFQNFGNANSEPQLERKCHFLPFPWEYQILVAPLDIVYVWPVPYTPLLFLPSMKRAT